MKRQFKKYMQHFAALMLGVFLISGPVAEAALNTGTGDVAGDTDALTNSVPFELQNAGNGNVGNLQLDINSDAVWAIMFSATMP